MCNLSPGVLTRRNNRDNIARRARGGPGPHATASCTRLGTTSGPIRAGETGYANTSEPVRHAGSGKELVAFNQRRESVLSGGSARAVSHRGYRADLRGEHVRAGRDEGAPAAEGVPGADGDDPERLGAGPQRGGRGRPGDEGVGDR